MSSILVKTPDYSPWFSAKKMKNLTLANNDILCARARQEEQNGANFSFIAPSSEEL